MYAPIDPTDRNMENLYNIIIKYDIDKLKDPTTFGNFFSEFMYLIDKEKKNSENQFGDLKYLYYICNVRQSLSYFIV